MPDDLFVALDPATQTGLSVTGTLFTSGSTATNSYSLSESPALSAVYRNTAPLSPAVPDGTYLGRYTTPAGEVGTEDQPVQFVSNARLKNSTSADVLAVPAAVWNALTSGMTTAGSLGLKLKNWVLGTDNKSLISTDASAIPAGAITAAAIAANALTTQNVSNCQNVLGTITTVSAGAAASIASAIQTLGAISFSIVSPVMQNGTIAIVKGDDYYNADGRALTWTATAGAWPNLTAGTVQLQLRIYQSNRNSGSVTLNVAGVISAGGTGAQSVYFELSNAQTAALAAGADIAYTFGVVATLSDAHVVTIAQGTVSVKTEP